MRPVKFNCSKEKLFFSKLSRIIAQSQDKNWSSRNKVDGINEWRIDRKKKERKYLNKNRKNRWLKTNEKEESIDRTKVESIDGIDGIGEERKDLNKRREKRFE